RACQSQLRLLDGPRDRDSCLDAGNLARDSDIHLRVHVAEKVDGASRIDIEPSSLERVAARQRVEPASDREQPARSLVKVEFAIRAQIEAAKAERCRPGDLYVFAGHP